MSYTSLVQYRYDPRYRALLEQLFDAESLDEHPESVFAIDRDGRVIFVNAGWSRFARSHGEDPETALASGIGTNFFAAISEPLRSFS